MKLPKYAEDIIQHVAKCEERAIGTPAQDAFARMKKELVDESLTAKNPVPKRAETNPWPQDNKLPDDFKPNFKKWLDWKSNDTICLNTKAKFEDHPDIEEDICVTDGKMGFIYPFTCQGPRGCPDTDHDWIHLSVEKNVLFHADDEKKIIKDPYGGGELVITNWRAIMRELIEKGMKQEGYTQKKNPRRSDGMKPSDLNQEQLYIGTRHEREHTDDMREAQRIAMDHLAEDPDYYKKLLKCVEGVEAEETWVDEQSNPTKPTVSELTKVFRETIKDPLTGMKIPGFNESQLGRALDKEEQDEVWRDIQLFIQKMVDQMLEKVMGLNLSREDGKPAALEFAQDPEQTKGESRERIETNRYYKLFFTSYLMSLLQRFFYVSPVGVKAVFDSLEGKKLYGEKNGWRRLAQFGNREANAMAVYIGMLALMNKVSSKNLALWLDANPDHVKKIYEDADERWTKILAARGKVGEKELERINKERREAKKAVASLKATRPDHVKGSKLEVAKEKVRAPKEQKSLAEIKKKLANYEKKPPETAADFIIQDAEKKRH